MNCCTPGHDGPAHARAGAGGAAPNGSGKNDSHTNSSGTNGSGTHLVRQAVIPGGEFAMGDAHGDGYRADGELPVHRVTLRPFMIDRTAVTVAAFRTFVDATGYVTDAERFGSSAVFHSYAEGGVPLPEAPWWRTVDGATWRFPGGPGTVAVADHPVVHVSHADALAYCMWTGRDLPTEAQWEYAARGGLEGARYPWGDRHPRPQQIDIFTGTFPWEPTGPVGTVPADAHAPNGFGLHQTVGNVWEWCCDRYSARYYSRSPSADPTGPDRGNSRVLRGGSHLCHDSYCYRYRVSARSHSTPDSSASNIGFRTVTA
ncbi:formylglycine-generating enzyme family protein [Tsukamurella sp. 8F]|uniref:formylglycine-generating enzyme family protein n=1 Tax=unclassified Tsukamurella TaxID=2633480 RepID=UPI0023B92250|nr:MULTISPECIES: formylglycine-generating enzyme family protein [unclassified Tsukamurella]MDF0528397.1 formylglycine-generating enzyme family protein [Tsukamurella sp. 8J]MDF0586222.1 formylglycine-generating enzyme family protein [Tsukamurella sp. 8F]